MSGCPRCHGNSGWVVVDPGDIGQPDTVRPCDSCCREAFDAWRSGKFGPRHKGMDRDNDDPQMLDPGENVARLLAIRDRLGI